MEWKQHLWGNVFLLHSWWRISPSKHIIVTSRSVLAWKWLKEEHGGWRPQLLAAPHCSVRGRATITTFLIIKAPVSLQLSVYFESVLPCAGHSPALSSSEEWQIFGLQLIKMGSKAHFSSYRISPTLTQVLLFWLQGEQRDKRSSEISDASWNTDHAPSSPS